MGKRHESSSTNLAEFYSLTSLRAYNFNQIALDFISFNFKHFKTLSIIQNVPQKDFPLIHKF